MAKPTFPPAKPGKGKPSKDEKTMPPKKGDKGKPGKKGC